MSSKKTWTFESVLNFEDFFPLCCLLAFQIKLSVCGEHLKLFVPLRKVCNDTCIVGSLLFNKTYFREKKLKIQFSIIAEDRIFLRMKVLEKDYILKLIFDLNKIQ